MSPPRQVHVCGMSGVAVLGGLKKVRVLDLCHNRGSETEQMMGGPSCLFCYMSVFTLEGCQ